MQKNIKHINPNLIKLMLKFWLKDLEHLSVANALVGTMNERALVYLDIEYVY